MAVEIFKQGMAAIAISLTIAAFFPYIRSVLRGITRPHVISWVIWGMTTLVVFLAQLSDGGGAGAWPIGVSAMITLSIAWLAMCRKPDNSITVTDWLFLITAMAALPLWYFTSDPLVAVVLLTTADLLGFGPTFRKAYHHPNEEHLLFFVLVTMRNLVAILALEHYSMTTILFPLATGFACMLLILVVMYRRRVLTH